MKRTLLAFSLFLCLKSHAQTNSGNTSSGGNQSTMTSSPADEAPTSFQNKQQDTSKTRKPSKNKNMRSGNNSSAGMSGSTTDEAPTNFQNKQQDSSVRRSGKGRGMNHNRMNAGDSSNMRRNSGNGQSAVKPNE